MAPIGQGTCQNKHEAFRPGSTFQLWASCSSLQPDPQGWLLPPPVKPRLSGLLAALAALGAPYTATLSPGLPAARPSPENLQFQQRLDCHSSPVTAHSFYKDSGPARGTQMPPPCPQPCLFPVPTPTSRHTCRYYTHRPCRAPRGDWEPSFPLRWTPPPYHHAYSRTWHSSEIIQTRSPLLHLLCLH